jgi:hypothetical protein
VDRLFPFGFFGLTCHSVKSFLVLVCLGSAALQAALQKRGAQDAGGRASVSMYRLAQNKGILGHLAGLQSRSTGCVRYSGRWTCGTGRPRRFNSLRSGRLKRSEGFQLLNMGSSFLNAPR